MVTIFMKEREKKMSPSHQSPSMLNIPVLRKRSCSLNIVSSTEDGYDEEILRSARNDCEME